MRSLPPPDPPNHLLRHPRLACSLALLLTALASCRGSAARETGVSREQFVATMVDLKQVGRRGDDSARQRARVLRRHRVDPAALREFVEARAERPEELAEVWEEIADGVRRADSVALADSLRADSVARAARADSLPADSAAADSVRRARRRAP